MTENPDITAERLTDSDENEEVENEVENTQNLLLVEESIEENEDVDGIKKEEEKEENPLKKFLRKHSWYIYCIVSILILLYLISMLVLGVVLTFTLKKKYSGGKSEPDIPQPEDLGSSYNVLFINETESSFLTKGYLKYTASSSNSSEYPNFETLSFEIYHYQKIVRLKIFPVDEDLKKIDRWEVPIPLSLPQLQPKETTSYRIVIGKDPFFIEILDSKTNERISKFYDLQFSDQYLSIKSTYNPIEEKLYGFSTRDFLLNPEKTKMEEKCFYLWNKDEYLRYHSHPFTLFVNIKSQIQKGLLFLTSNLIESCLFPKSSFVEYRIIGGIFDIFFFPNGNDIIEQFQKILGPKHKSVPPLWSLGFHQSRWGYNNISVLRDVIESYEYHGIPLDGVWSDIDYMEEYKDFTFDPISFPLLEMKNFSDYLHNEKKKKYIVIIDPGIKTRESYFPYHLGKQEDIFVKTSPGSSLKKYTVGIVWPGYTVYPDFSHPNIKDKYWKPLLKSFMIDNGGIQIDGLWIDMNEPSNFCHGLCNLPEGVPPSSSSLESPPYLPEAMLKKGEKLWTKTIPLESEFHGGIKAYDIHNMYGYHESIVTHQSIEELTNSRSFVLTRSTFLGSGCYVSNWLGDNYASWDDLFTSVNGVFSQNMFGIQHVGADICGFHDFVTSELCFRWYQLGSMYPFARQHSDKFDSNLKEPYRFGNSFTNKVKSLIDTRYSLIPYFYSLFHRFRMDNFGMIWSPIFLGLSEFLLNNEEEKMYETFDQIMIGKCIMIAPILEPNTVSRKIWFPLTFYDFHTSRKMPVSISLEDKKLVAEDEVSGSLLMYYKEKCIVPKQIPGLSTEQQKTNPYQLFITITGSQEYFLNDEKSYGELFLDDGNDVIEEDNFDGITHFEFAFDPNTLVLNGDMVMGGYKGSNQLVVNNISFLGYVWEKPSSILINHDFSHLDFSYEAVNEVLILFNLNLYLNESFVVEIV